MKSRRLCVPLLALLILAAGCANGLADKLNAKAAEAKKAAIVPRLQKLAVELPDAAQEANEVVAHWDLRTESANYTMSKPLLDKWVLLHPEDADAVSRVMRNWKERIDKFYPAPA